MPCAGDTGNPLSEHAQLGVSADDQNGFYMQMTHPVVSRRSWQLADLSRTVDDTVLALEYNRLQLRAAPARDDRMKLQRDLAQIIEAILLLLVRGEREQTITLSSQRDVVVPNSIVEALRRSVHDEQQLTDRLKVLVEVLPNADSLDGDLVEVLDMIAEVADVEATASMRPLMRK